MLFIFACENQIIKKPSEHVSRILVDVITPLSPLVVLELKTEST